MRCPKNLAPRLNCIEAPAAMNKGVRNWRAIITVASLHRTELYENRGKPSIPGFGEGSTICWKFSQYTQNVLRLGAIVIGRELLLRLAIVKVLFSGWLTSAKPLSRRLWLALAQMGRSWEYLILVYAYFEHRHVILSRRPS